MKPPRPHRPDTDHALAEAVELLRHAREAAKRADSPRAAAAIRRALKSTEGAQRHASTRRRRTEDQAPSYLRRAYWTQPAPKTP